MITVSVMASASICFTSSHMRASQDLDAQVGKRHPRLPRRHRHQAVAGHARRRVDLEQRKAAVGAQDQVEPAPPAAADDIERASATARISISLASGKPAGQKYFVSSEKYLL